jgi:hypothetical protein
VAQYLRPTRLYRTAKPDTTLNDRRHSTGSTPTPTAAGTATSPIATATNTADAPMATQSDAQNLAVEDAIDERTFNQAIWQSIHGPGSVMPEPRHTHD